MNQRLGHLITCILICILAQPTFANDVLIDADSQATLSVPELSSGPPAAGKRVAITPPEYDGTNVSHILYLPENWQESGKAVPIIFEYTGNYFPKTGSTGLPKDAALGFGLSAGKYIWVSLPYLSNDGTENAVTWWGDEWATIEYAKRNVPRIITEFGADPSAVFLCGFSRGAIGVNYIGLHDDNVSRLWTAFITHDHFDGVKLWKGTSWGSPLEQYREAASERLRRVGDRPYFVSQNGKKRDSEEFIRSVLADASHFSFGYVNTREFLGEFPNKFAMASHNDRWPLKPSKYRTEVWTWMNSVVKDAR